MNFGTWKASTSTCQSTSTARCTTRMIAKDLADRPLTPSTVCSFQRVRHGCAASIYRVRGHLSTNWLISASWPQRLQHQVDDMLAAGTPCRRACQILAEDRRQGRRVREEEIAQARDGNIEVHRVDALSEHALAHTL